MVNLIQKKINLQGWILADGATTEYYMYYRFTARDTNTPGRYQGQFLIKNEQGNLIVPIREELYVNVEDSFISETACC